MAEIFLTHRPHHWSPLERTPITEDEVKQIFGIEVAAEDSPDGVRVVVKAEGRILDAAIVNPDTLEYTALDISGWGFTDKPIVIPTQKGMHVHIYPFDEDFPGVHAVEVQL